MSSCTGHHHSRAAGAQSPTFRRIHRMNRMSLGRAACSISKPRMQQGAEFIASFLGCLE